MWYIIVAVVSAVVTWFAKDAVQTKFLELREKYKKD